MNESNNKQLLSNGNTKEDLIARLPIPGPGRKKGYKDDPVKKARKQLIEEYKDALAEALPMISPVLIKKAFSGEGDLGAIKEINDILVDKAPKNVDVTTGGDKIQPILVRFLDKDE